MKRADFEHLIAAAANIVGEDEFVVIGSQAILGSLPEAPEELLTSMEVDIYPKQSPEKINAIDGALGDGSLFHETFGFYAHGVGPVTAKPPAGWEQRLVRVEIPGRVASTRSPVAFCLEPHDLVLAKCVAGRARDWEFARHALASAVVDWSILDERIETLPVSRQMRDSIRSMLVAISGSGA